MIISTHYHVLLIKMYKFVKIDCDGQHQNITPMVEVWLVCVHYGFNIMSCMLLDHISGWLSRFRPLFQHIVMFIDQNMYKYVKIDRDDQNQNITLKTEVWFVWIVYGFNIIPWILLVHIRGDQAGLDDYFNILSC